MRRWLTRWQIAALVGLMIGCGAESTPTPHAVFDVTQTLDSTSDSSVGSSDAPWPDAALDVDVSESDISSDASIAPEIPPVFVDCQVVKELQCGDIVEEVSNGGPGATQILGWYACQPEVKAKYAASPERTYLFTASQSVKVTVQETSNTSVDLFAVRDSGEGCAGSASSCVVGDSKTITWTAEEGESYFVILDDRDGYESTLDFTVSCCEPSCEGRVCGGDGCGGTCGECDKDKVCDGGTCVEPSILSCNPSVPLACGDVLVGESFLSTDTTSSIEKLNCTDEPTLGPERAYSLEIQDAGLVTVLVTSESEEISGVFLLDAVAAACDSNACLTSGKNELAYLAQENDQYTFLVEGEEGAKSTYDVVVTCCTPSCDGIECGDDGCGGSCGACAQDSVCMNGNCSIPPDPTCEVTDVIACGEAPVEVELGSEVGSDTMFSSPCVEGDLSGSEAAFTFHSKENANVSFKVESKDFPGKVALTLLSDDGLGCKGDLCLAGDVEVLDANVSADQSYFLVVDGLDGVEGKVTLSASCCTPSCGGKSCGGDGCGGSCGDCGEGLVCQKNQCEAMPAPTCTPELTLECGESIGGQLSTVPGAPASIYGYSCNPFDYSGAEVAYAFKTQVPAKVQVGLNPAPDAGELDLFWVEDADGVCDSVNCKAWGDSSLTFSASVGEVSYLVVDGFMGAGGSYDLSVECCYPACEGKACGEDDGCGTTCGCQGTEVCFQGVCKEPAKGNSCDDPWEIDNLPYKKSSTTNGPFADALNTGGGCDSVFGVGDGVKDVVYRYVPAVSGVYSMVLEGLEEGDAPSVLYVLKDCSYPMSTCLGYTDEVELGVADLEVALEAGKAVYVVVDGLAVGDVGEFTFSMDGPLQDGTK